MRKEENTVAGWKFNVCGRKELKMAFIVKGWMDGFHLKACLNVLHTLIYIQGWV